MLQKRILDISYKHKLSHLGSCLTAVPIIDHIYSTKKPEDLFVLSSGHAGLALYVVLEKYFGCDAEELLEKNGIHPVMDHNHIAVSTGSLGQGITVAVGLALANRLRTVHCLISDGECAEGSVWESLAFKEKAKLDNLVIHANVNGYAAYETVNTNRLSTKLKVFCYDVKVHFTDFSKFPFLKGLEAHYHVLTDEEYKEVSNATYVC